MGHRFLAVALALALAACGQGSGQRDTGERAATAGSCPLIGDAAQLFGAGAEAVGDDNFDTMAGTCTLASADGRLGGDIVTYTQASLGAATLDQKFTEVSQAWDAMTETPLAPVEGLGEASTLATDLPGYQTQIMFRKGDTLVLISARSGDENTTGEQLARRMAAAVAANLGS